MKKRTPEKEHIPQKIHPLFKDRFCYTLSKTGILFRTMLELSLKKQKIVLPQAGILHFLNGYGEFNQNLLVQEMSIDKASMVKYIDGLEKLGMVKRKTDPKDRRAKLLTLTAKGKATQKKIHELHQQIADEILEGFPPEEVAVLKKLMPQILEKVLLRLNKK